MSDPNEELNNFFQDVIASNGNFSEKAKESFQNKLNKWITALTKQDVYAPIDFIQVNLERVGMPPQLVNACMIKSGKGIYSILFYLRILFYAMRIVFCLGILRMITNT